MAEFYFGSVYEDFAAVFPFPNNLAVGDDGEFKLGSLPTDLLEGVMQRLPDRSKGKGYMERVNQRFATIAHRLAWRHHHTLKIKHLSRYSSRVDVGPFFVGWEDAAAAAHFLIARSTIHHVQFDFDGSKFFEGAPLPVVLSQEAGQGIMEALLSSDRVALRSLILNRSTETLFGGSDQVVALIRRHSATLQEAGVYFYDDQPTVQVGDALTGCPSLLELTAFVGKRCVYGQDLPLWQRPLEQLVHQLQLSKLTLKFNGSGWSCDAPPAAIAAVLPTVPKLTELRLKGFVSLFDPVLDWSPLADIRLFEAFALNLCLLDDSEQAEMNWVFSAVLPNLTTLILNGWDYEAIVYWGLLKKLVGAFLNRAGEASLAVELSVFSGNDGEAWRRPLTHWQTAFPQLSVEYFGIENQVLDGEAIAATRPALPKEFEHAAVSEVFILGRPNETRRITIAVWEFILGGDYFCRW